MSCEHEGLNQRADTICEKLAAGGYGESWPKKAPRDMTPTENRQRVAKLNDQIIAAYARGDKVTWLCHQYHIAPATLYWLLAERNIPKRGHRMPTKEASK